MAATDPTTSDQPEVGRSALHKIAWRQVPFLGLLYFVSEGRLATDAHASSRGSEGSCESWSR